MALATRTAEQGDGVRERPVTMNRRLPAYRRDSRLLILPALLSRSRSSSCRSSWWPRRACSIPTSPAVHYGEVFTNHVYRKVLLQTLRLAVIVTAIAVALGYPVAYFISHARPVVAGDRVARGARAAVDQPARPHLLVPGAVRPGGLRQQAAHATRRDRRTAAADVQHVHRGVGHGARPAAVRDPAVPRRDARDRPQPTRTPPRASGQRRGRPSATCTSR